MQGFTLQVTPAPVLYTLPAEISVGRNVIPVDKDFEVSRIGVYFNASLFKLRTTENKYYATTGYFVFDKLYCTFPCWGSAYNASVSQINGGGVNAKFVVYCSIEKFILDNINLFKMAFYNRIAVDLMRERILSDRFNRWTTLTSDRAKELMDYYRAEYDSFLTNSVRNLKAQEDPICFNCQSSVSSRNLIP